MRLVVDANIFVAELIRQRGRVLIARRDFELFVAEAAWDEAQYELRKRILAMVNQGKFSLETGETLLETAFALAEAKARLIPEAIYAPWKTQALLRIRRDPDDWPTVALALAVDAAIWTLDADFLGCGIATWTTETLLLIDRDEN
ncbi:MAG: nucleotide-binding protein, PIN domain-containing protein [Acaryochloridaceae cyanobacterium RU_4_10]|nr:nucleotide-binding protein, PIN domain-containing protein [Acaryochloridaceae cyanobacterium RU_4_10]